MKQPFAYCRRKLGAMTGEADLATLLKTLTPIKHDGVFVFCSFADQIPNELKPIATFREDEGYTAVIDLETADAIGIEYEFPSEWITTQVNSSLEAVGMTAAIANALTKRGISANVIAAFHHDHFFVPLGRGDEAIEAMYALANG